MNMNTNTVYTFEVVHPDSDKSQSDNNADDSKVDSNEGELIKTIVEGKLHETQVESDGSSRSIFVDCTLHYYYSNLTVPVVYTTDLYSVPTSWIKSTTS